MLKPQPDGEHPLLLELNTSPRDDRPFAGADGGPPAWTGICGPGAADPVRREAGGGRVNGPRAMRWATAALLAAASLCSGRAGAEAGSEPVVRFPAHRDRRRRPARQSCCRARRDQRAPRRQLLHDPAGPGAPGVRDAAVGRAGFGAADLAQPAARHAHRTPGAGSVERRPAAVGRGRDLRGQSGRGGGRRAPGELFGTAAYAPDAVRNFRQLGALLAPLRLRIVSVRISDRGSWRLTTTPQMQLELGRTSHPGGCSSAWPGSCRPTRCDGPAGRSGHAVRRALLERICGCQDALNQDTGRSKPPHENGQQGP